MDLLRAQNFSIDYRQKQLIFGESDIGPNQVIMNSDPLCLSVEMTVADRPVRVIVDTGVQSVVLYKDRLLRHGISYKAGIETMGVSLGGHVRSKQATMPRLRVGTFDIDRKVFLTESPGEKFLPGIEGFLGPTVLKARRVHFNFEKNTLSWTN
jgi:hypothetical protein